MDSITELTALLQQMQSSARTQQAAGADMQTRLATALEGLTEAVMALTSAVQASRRPDA